MRNWPWRIAVVLVVAGGCSSRPGAIRPPSVDPEDAADAAIEQYDRNGDGTLSQDEWTASPELASVAEHYDTSGDRALAADEIAAGIRRWQEGAVGARVVPFSVSLDGRPLPGATVRLVPAEFLGEEVKAASGDSSRSGSGNLGIAPEDLPKNAPNMPIMQPGLYRVEITHPSIKIPAKYNSQTTLGIEITSGNPRSEGVVWALTN